MQARKSIVMQWNLYPTYGALFGVTYAYCLLMRLFVSWLALLNLLLAFILHQVWSLLVHPKSFKPVLPHESTISTYMRYFFAILSKFVCAISNFQNKFLFVGLYRSWNGRGWLIYFHARYVILTMSVYSLVIAREYGKGIRDAQSRNEKINLLDVVK